MSTSCLKIMFGATAGGLRSKANFLQLVNETVQKQKDKKIWKEQRKQPPATTKKNLLQNRRDSVFYSFIFSFFQI